MPKLPQGMFRRKGRSGWYMRLYRAGGERWVSLGADYARACDKARALGAGLTVDPAKAGTVGPACERWLESYVKQARDEKGQKLAAQRVRAYLDPFFGHMLVERVTREDLRSFQLWLQTRFSLSVTSVWHVLSDVRCLFNWCEDAGLVERSPFPRRVMPKVQERPPDRLTDKASDVKRVRVAGAGEEQRYLEVSHTKSKRVRRVPLSPELAAELRGRVVAWCSMRQAHRDRSRPACAG